jgi:hypothetical protein
MIRLLYVLSLFFGISSCKAQRSSKNSGVLIKQYLILDSLTKKFIPLAKTRPTKIWFQKNLVIQEVDKIDVYTDALGNETWEAKVLYYILIDRNNLNIYQYHTFSDTAVCFKKYNYKDSPDDFFGWNCFSQDTFIYKTNRKLLNDTVVNGISYQRYSGSKLLTDVSGKQYQEVRVGYLSCDSRFSKIMSLDRVLSSEKKCPVLKIELFDYLNNKRIVSELQYLPRGLNELEESVFKAWKLISEKY